MKKILAIDDNAINLNLLKRIINIHYPDFLFIQALNGEKGIVLARDENPELILLDILMPGLNGYEVCTILKNDDQTRHIPVLMVSALGKDSSERIKGLDVGADAFISKPFRQDELRAQIDVAIRIKEAENELKRHVKKIEEYQVKLKELNREILMVEENERRRIAENLHDRLGQTLSLAYMKLSSALNLDNIRDIFKIMGDTSELINKAISESRTLTYDLSPPILFELGPLAAIKWKMEQISEKHGIHTEIRGREQVLKIQKEFNIFLYRIVAELFTNTIKHAKAKKIELEITKDKNMYIVIVRDDGVGFDIDKKLNASEMGGFGLMSIAERMDSINGSFEINSGPGVGTEAKIYIPVLKK